MRGSHGGRGGEGVGREKIRGHPGSYNCRKKQSAQDVNQFQERSGGELCSKAVKNDYSAQKRGGGGELLRTGAAAA